jgi:hypothetical protein
MRNGETQNGQKFTLVSLAKVDEPIEAMPQAPFGALVVACGTEIPWRDYETIATRLLKAGCAWATLHIANAGKKDMDRLHKVFDEAIVEYQLNVDDDAEMMTGGEDGESLKEVVHYTVWDAHPTYGDPFRELLILVVGEDKDNIAETAESLAKSVEQE